VDKEEVINKLINYKQLLSMHFDIDKVVLFGSYVKGNYREDSDIDVAVVVNSIHQDFFTYAPLLWKLRKGIDSRIEPILIDKHHDESGFLTEILKTGVIID
jgi:predicted nucleotidyltransferase